MNCLPTILSFLSLLPLISTTALSPRTSSTNLSILAGYHVIYSYSGTTVPAALLNSVKAGKVGGIILFGDNVDSAIATHMASIQSAYKQSASYPGYPLLIVTDQEGGEVKRLPGGPDMSAKEVGEQSNPASAATDAGTQAAASCTNAGVNGNLAPVLDVYRSPGDFEDQYQRSFGNTSALVSTCGTAFIKSQQAKGVVATAKHFPGLGAASADENTDEAPVTLNLTLAEIRSVDEAPYVKAIAAGVKMIMPSWATYPSLDADRPSGLSSKWIQSELRGRLGFKGVTISDAIEAGGLEAFGSDDGARAVLAMQAGMDIILAAAEDESQGSEIVDAIVAALNDDTLDRDAFDASTNRILSLRKGL
ncbi:putative glycosyl hydrolase [Rhizodiscina lignyota]|uniref:Glycosyl hydrolase n=1 Tax=Rhizodiscina lignyota TaxID=1504668 RepID=A0A9P4IAF4_9PEZI|nr:putative glycosyl hydrolase [Rhizodiscina lignyota]